jgi:uncharacterized protein
VKRANTLDTAPAKSNNLLEVMRRHLLVSYFLIAYAVTWSIGLVFIVLLHRPPTLEVVVPMIAGPTIGAFIMTAVAEGRPGVGGLLRRYALWRVDLAWYLLVLVGMPALLMLSIMIVPGGANIVSHIIPNYPMAFVVALFVGGALFEEPGWRGFALPRLQQQFGPLRGTLLLGVVWAFWHLPLFFVPGFNGAGSDLIGIGAAVASFLVGTTAMAVIFTWVSNNTRGSLLLAILLHASLDTAGPSFGSLLIFGALYAGIAALALIVIVATRGRLSYERFEPNWRPLTQYHRWDDDRLTSVHPTGA